MSKDLGGWFLEEQKMPNNKIKILGMSFVGQGREFIEKVFELLKKEKSVTGRPFSIIYFSDHGLAHKTEKNKTTLTNNFASKFHYDIPLIKIDSDRNDRIELSSEKSGLNFTEGLGNWMNIQNPDLPKTSLFDGKSQLPRPEGRGLKKPLVD